MVGLLKVPLNRALGVPGALINAALGSYLIIASTVSFATGFGPVWNAWEHFEDYASSIILILAAALGGYSVMRFIGSESLLKVVLVFLTVDCIAILATPVLSEFYVITGLLPYRFLGNFKNPIFLCQQSVKAVIRSLLAIPVEVVLRREKREMTACLQFDF